MEPEDKGNQADGHAVPGEVGNRIICETCENRSLSSSCILCHWPKDTKYPTEYKGKKFRTTKGMDNIWNAKGSLTLPEDEPDNAERIPKSTDDMVPGKWYGQVYGKGIVTGPMDDAMADDWLFEIVKGWLEAGSTCRPRPPRLIRKDGGITAAYTSPDRQTMDVNVGTLFQEDTEDELTLTHEQTRSWVKTLDRLLQETDKFAMPNIAIAKAVDKIAEARDTLRKGVF